MGNFTFLENRWSDLAKLGDLSEKYVYSDPNTSIIKQGMLAEVMVKYMLAYDGIKEPDYDNTHANRIRLLKRNDLLPHEIDNTLYILRKARNDAAHEGADEGEKALNNLPLLYELCIWYMQTYGDYSYSPAEYVQPVDITVSLDELERENRELEERNKTLLVELQRIQKYGKSDSARRAIAYKKALNVKLSEAQTRELIDEQLRKVGWDADTVEIRYPKGTRPVKGRNLAIAEWPTDSSTGNGGYADYALFIGEKMVGIIEAKKKHTNISSVLDGQCKEYARRIKAEHEKYVLKQYGEYKVPFLFATNGRDYIKQYEEMSGIWFLDTRQQFNTSKALSGWPSPEGLEQDLERDIAEADKRLAATGYELLEDSNGLGLRYYQVEAVKAAEKAIAEHKNTVLLAMATGTGKTRTVLGMIYRFLSAKRFKRILYLVDRTALGDQTMDTFKEVKLEDLKTLNQLYDIKDLGEKEFEKDTRVHIATVQSLVKRILYNESDVSIGVSDYDCIIVDECHHAASDTISSVLKEVKAKYVYGVTATPKRADGLEKINYMWIGPIRYSYTAKEMAAAQGVEHYVYPRFTRTVAPRGVITDKMHPNAAYDIIHGNSIRDEQIISDVKTCVLQGRTPVVLSKYKDHSEKLYSRLKEYADHVFLMTGNNSKKEHKKILEQLHEVSKEETLILVATGSLIGEGFDYPRLDTLFMAMPVSARNIVEQYAGRLNRDYEGKKEVIVYDYVDSHIPMFDNMYAKRLKAYKQIGYEVCTGIKGEKQTANAIFGGDNYVEVFQRDLLEADNNIIISSPVISGSKVYELIRLLKDKQVNGVDVTIVTWEPDSYGFGDAGFWMQLHEEIRQAGFYIETVEDLCEHFSIIDQNIVWYGNINILGNAKLEDSMMRLESKEIAAELMEITFGEKI